ncbi:MAG TPA: hypothetical protein VIY52_08320 [Streptosporangiaceae bacterium]
MNDNDLITMVRESFTDIRSATPVQQIQRHGRAVRARRRIPLLAGAAAAAAGAVLAVTALLPGAHQPSPQPTAQLAAWTVAKQADGTIRVTIFELRDPAELQRQLSADGVPASVTLIGQENPSCRPYPASAALRKRVLSITFDIVPLLHQGPPPSTPPPQPNLVLVFHISPSALPPGTGVQIATSFTPVRPGLARSSIASGLVYASPQCTGT